MAFTPAPAPAADRGYDQSAVPPALRKKAAASEKALELIRAGKDPHDPANWQEQQQGNPPPQQPQERQEAQPPANPAPTQPTPPETRQEPPQQPSGDDQTWEQRYRSLEGQFRTQQRTLQGYEGEINQLRSAIQRLEQGGAPQGGQRQELPAGQKGHVDITKIFSEEEQNDWGPEWVNSMQKLANAVAGPLQARIDQLEGTTTNIVQRETRTARQIMQDGLTSVGIDIDELNLSHDWLEWINNVDVGAGKLRRDLIQEAWNRNEGSRVEYFVRQFLREMRNAEPEAQPPKTEAKGRAAAPQRKGLEDLAAPGKAKGQEPPKTGGDASQPETFTAKQYADFYRDKSLGRLKMTPEDQASWEKRLNDAYREGRIIQTPTE